MITDKYFIYVSFYTPAYSGDRKISDPKWVVSRKFKKCALKVCCGGVHLQSQCSVGKRTRL